jgi:hypothetical protein
MTLRDALPGTEYCGRMVSTQLRIPEVLSSGLGPETGAAFHIGAPGHDFNELVCMDI